MDMYGHPTAMRDVSLQYVIVLSNEVMQHSIVKSIAISSDDVLSCTVSKSIAKVWNVGDR